jgi:hypothetical protein
VDRLASLVNVVMAFAILVNAVTAVHKLIHLVARRTASVLYVEMGTSILVKPVTMEINLRTTVALKDAKLKSVQ